MCARSWQTLSTQPQTQPKQNPAENNRCHINGKAAEPQGGQPVAAWPKAQQNGSSRLVEAGHRHSHGGTQLVSPEPQVQRNSPQDATRLP